MSVEAGEVTEVPQVVAPTKPEKRVPVITDDDRENFFKAFISDIPYVETLKLFDGKLKISFRTLNIDENDEVFRQINYDQAKGIAASDDSYYVKIVEYRLAGSITQINGEDFCKDITPETHPHDAEKGTTYILDRVKEIQKWNTFKLGAITEAFNFFEAKVLALTEDSVKGNF